MRGGGPGIPVFRPAGPTDDGRESGIRPVDTVEGPADDDDGSRGIDLRIDFIQAEGSRRRTSTGLEIVTVRSVGMTRRGRRW
jgi:hypothetical protein